MPIKNRLQKNYKHKKKWANKSQISAYRLYEKDIPEYPFIIDVYGDNVVLYKRTNDIDSDKAQNFKDTTDALVDILNIEESNIFVKQRIKQKGKNQYDNLSKSSKKITVNENGLNFNINLTDYLDVGLFLDHRPLRKKVGELSAGKYVLNLFCYTGSFSVYAAENDAAHVTSVDLSKTYINWTKENFKSNNLNIDDYEFIEKDCIEFLKETKTKYDIIVLDPPTFSNSKKFQGTLDIERDQFTLIRLTMKSLSKDGVLFFSNNKRGFKLSDEIIKEYEVKDITKWSIPNDFRDEKIHVCFEIRHKQ